MTPKFCSTLRIWSTDDFKVITKCINSQRKVIKTKNASGKRAIPTTCCYSADGKLIAAGCDDGSIQIWKNGKMFVSTFWNILYFVGVGVILLRCIKFFWGFTLHRSRRS